jgi:hypothetical protein
LLKRLSFLHRMFLAHLSKIRWALLNVFMSVSSVLLNWSSYLFLLLWLCSIVWSQILCYLQHCLFWSVLPCLFMVFCVSKWTLGLIFQSLWWMSLWFCW